MIVRRIVLHHDELADIFALLGCILNSAVIRIDDLAFHGMGFLIAKDDVRSTALTIHLQGRKGAAGAIFIEDCFRCCCIGGTGIGNHNIIFCGILLIYIQQADLIVDG